MVETHSYVNVCVITIQVELVHTMFQKSSLVIGTVHVTFSASWLPELRWGQIKVHWQSYHVE